MLVILICDASAEDPVFTGDTGTVGDYSSTYVSMPGHSRYAEPLHDIQNTFSSKPRSLTFKIRYASCSTSLARQMLHRPIVNRQFSRRSVITVIMYYL